MHRTQRATWLSTSTSRTLLNEHANNMQLLKEAKDWDNDSSPEQNGDPKHFGFFKAGETDRQSSALSFYN